MKLVHSIPEFSRSCWLRWPSGCLTRPHARPRIRVLGSESDSAPVRSGPVGSYSAWLRAAPWPRRPREVVTVRKSLENIEHRIHHFAFPRQMHVHSDRHRRGVRLALLNQYVEGSVDGLESNAPRYFFRSGGNKFRTQPGAQTKASRAWRRTFDSGCRRGATRNVLRYGSNG
jgi:hypothetical protein